VRNLWCVTGTNQGTPKTKALGAELRKVREDADFGLRELADKIGISHSTLSRYENGSRSPEPETLATILGAIGISAEKREELLDLSREPDRANWLGVGRTEQQRQLGTLLDYEAEATVITNVSPLLVPGLLQTGAYTRAIMEQGGVPAEEISTRVSVRLGRRDTLTRKDPAHFRAVTSEAVLRQNIGGPEAMLEQLQYLARMDDLPNVELRVIPIKCGWHPGHDGPFTLVEFADKTPVVHLENRRAGLFFHEEEDTAVYTEAVEKVFHAALSPDESARLIDDVIHEYERR
jgi:transcriptional regulator with XRE-family HTH domain